MGNYRKYWIDQGEFANQYSLAYTETDEDAAAAEKKGWERISLAKAKEKARAERERRKLNPSFAFLADIYIWPWGKADRLYHSGNYDVVNNYIVVERKGRNAK